MDRPRLLRRLAAVACTVAFVAAPGPVRAETFLDVYGGLVLAEDAGVRAELPIAGESVLREVEFGDSLSVGGRVGGWLDNLPWLGFALDGSYFAPAGSGVEIEVVSLTPMLMLRLPLLASAEFPNGRLQPYVAAGPGVYFVDIEVDFRPALSRAIDGLSIEAGLDARAGLAWHMTGNLALFAEYRRTSHDVSVENETLGFLFGLPSRVNERIDTRLDTNHLLLGLSFRF